MGEAILPSRIVDENTLNYGFVILTGGEDRFGRPLLTFPANEILTVTKQTTPGSLTLNLQYYLQLLPIDKRAFGVSVLANFYAATKDVIILVCEALEHLQTESPKAISTLYTIQPKSKDLQKTLKKLLGLKASKKNPKIPLYESVILQDKSSLTQYIAANQLTEEYGGSLPYNHQAWTVLKRKFEELERDVHAVEAKVPDISDKVHMLLEYDIPASVEDNETLLNTIQQKYNDLMKELKIEIVIDDLGTFQDRIEHPASHPTYSQITATVTFKNAKIKVQGHRAKLIKIREDLAAVYRQAESRISTASKVGKYKLKAEKVLRWLSEIGFPTVNQDPEIADCLPQAEILKDHFHTGFYSIAKDVLSVSDKIIKKFDILIKEAKGHGTQELAIYRKNFVTTINRFKDMVEKKKQVYENVYNFFFNAVLLPPNSDKARPVTKEIKQAVRWYHKALTFLPFQLLQQPSIPNADNKASVYVSAALKVAMENFLLRHPAPSTSHLNKIKNLIATVKDATVKNQARLTVQRVSDVKRLMSNPGSLTVQNLKDIIFWKQQLAAGEDDIYSGNNASASLAVDEADLTISGPHISVPDLPQDLNVSQKQHHVSFEKQVRRPASSMSHAYRHQGQTHGEPPRDLSYVTWRRQKLLKHTPRHHQSFSHGTSPYIGQMLRGGPQRSESQRRSPHLMSQSTLEINHNEDFSEAERLAMRTPKLRFVGVDDSVDSVQDIRVQSPSHGVRFRTKSMNALNQKDNARKGFDIEGESDYPEREKYATVGSKRTLFPPHLSRSLDGKERYINLSYSKPGTKELPKTLQHIDVRALRENIPQRHVSHVRGHHFRDQRTIENMPSVTVADSFVATSMPNLARPTSIEAISQSQLSVEEKLNLMSMLCESDETDASLPVRPESAFDTESRTRRQYSRSRQARPSRPASAGPRAFEKTYRNAQLPLTYHRKSFDENATESTLTQGKPVVRSKSGASRWGNSLTVPRRTATLDSSSTARTVTKRPHYGIDIEQWMRSQHSDTMDDETDPPVESELSEGVSIDEEEVMQNQVASSLQRVHDILQEQEEGMKISQINLPIQQQSEINGKPECGPPTQEHGPEHDSHFHGPVEGSLSEESGIFTHESAETSRIRPLDSIANMPQTIDSRAGVFVPSLRPSTTALCSKTEDNQSSLKAMPQILTKSTSNLARLVTPQETQGEDHSDDFIMNSQGDSDNLKPYPQSRISGTLVGNHERLVSQDLGSFTELTTSSQA